MAKQNNHTINPYLLFGSSFTGGGSTTATGAGSTTARSRRGGGGKRLLDCAMEFPQRQANVRIL
jgi:hypothetical protein